MSAFKLLDIECHDCGAEFETRCQRDSDGVLEFWVPEREICADCFGERSRSVEVDD